jgi:hypothetical protein
MIHTSNKEIPGGSIALVATNNKEVQEPQATLGRLHASHQKQVVFTRRILEKEDEVAHVNSELSDFLHGLDPPIPTFAFLSVGDQVEGSQPICGQRWANGTRRMTATSTTGSERLSGRCCIEWYCRCVGVAIYSRDVRSSPSTPRQTGRDPS